MHTKLTINDIGFFFKIYAYKLDGVGPVDNRPSTDKLHHFVRRKKKKKKRRKKT